MPTDVQAIWLLNEQLIKLGAVLSLDYKAPLFVSWYDMTKTLIQRFLRPDSPHRIRFERLKFRGQTQVRMHPYGYRGPIPSPTVSPRDKAQFVEDCRTAQECIKGAIEEVKTFGIHAEEPKPKSQRRDAGGFHQHITGSVNMAIATDNATQNVGNIGETGSDLKEVSELLMQSMEITGRERLDALQAIEGITAESQKPPERRNWKAVFGWAELALGVANKATDIAGKLAPHLTHITAILTEAGRRIQGG